MDFFVKAKHWQLFMLMFSLLFTIIIASTLIAALDFKTDDKTFEIAWYICVILYIAGISIMFLSMILWQYIVGKRSSSFTKRYLLHLLNFSFLIIIIAFFFYLILVVVRIPVTLKMVRNEYYEYSVSPLIVTLLKWSRALGAIAYVYIILYSAGVLVRREKSNTLNHILYFLSFLIFPIGIWFIQPRINKIFATEYEQETIDIPEGYL